MDHIRLSLWHILLGLIGLFNLGLIVQILEHLDDAFENFIDIFGILRRFFYICLGWNRVEKLFLRTLIEHLAAGDLVTEVIHLHQLTKAICNLV
jgi:hypothetical protein